MPVILFARKALLQAFLTCFSPENRIDKDIKPALKVGIQVILKTAYTNDGKSPPSGACKINKIS